MYEQREEMTEKQIKLSFKIFKVLRKYFKLYRKVNDYKAPFIWVEHIETGQFILYSNGEYTKRIKKLIATLD